MFHSAMKMYWNWDIANTIIFTWWNTSSVIGILTACITVTFLSIGYEFLSYFQQSRDREAITHQITYASLGAHGDLQYSSPGRFQRSLLYGLRTLLGILLMLIMMTFNGFLILSIVIGATAGHYLLGSGGTGHHH